jgi:hypothetical protein
MSKTTTVFWGWILSHLQAKLWQVRSKEVIFSLDEAETLAAFHRPVTVGFASTSFTRKWKKESAFETFWNF